METSFYMKNNDSPYHLLHNLHKTQEAYMMGKAGYYPYPNRFRILIL